MESVPTYKIVLNEFPSLLRLIPRASPIIPRKSRNGIGNAVLIIEGYLAAKYFYADMRNYFEERGFRACLVDIGVNVRRFRTSVALLEKEILTLFRPEEEITIIGHSLGGAIGIALLALSPLGKRVKEVIALGTPVLGCPYRPLSLLVSLTVGISEKTFEEFRPQIKEVSHKITMISAPNDDIAPPDKCRIPDSYARHIELSKVFPNTHINHIDLMSDKNIWVYLEALMKKKRRHKKPA